MEKTWYKEGVVYQIYPRSFKDSNNDGLGDLNGITEKLDYLKDLGVSIVWLSPIYASPMKDNGYDISDYYSINPEFGTMDDFKKLLDGLHQRGIKLVMDLVINHTSNEHYWFKEALKGKDNPYHDYYIWKKKEKGKLPNNWTGFFSGTTWKYVESLDEYYLHLFAEEQPDLNWENEKVREEIKKMLKFWLDLGVDGFRCDVINLLSKAQGLPNGKRTLILQGKEHYINGPKIHDYLKELKNDVFSKYDMFTVGESCLISPKKALEFISFGEEELNMLFQFDHMAADNYFVKWFLRKFKPSRLKKALSKWQNEINGKGWNTLYFENHDQPRAVTRFGSEEYRIESAKMLATFLFFQQGTPFIYQGQEIGMTNPHFKNIDEYEDVESRNIYKMGREKLHFSHKSMMKRIEYMSRDNARTPMQWDDSENAGFSSHKPWYTINKNYKDVNVLKDKNDKNGVYSFFKEIISLRKKYEIIVYGDYKEYYPRSNKVVCYERNLSGDKLLVVCNYSSSTRKIRLPLDIKDAKLILNNYNVDENEYKPYQAKVYLIRKKG